MSENEGNKVPVRVPESVLDGIRNEQHRIRNLRPKVEKIPTQGDLLEQAWATYMKSGKSPLPTSDVPQKTSLNRGVENTSGIPAQFQSLFSSGETRKHLEMFAAILDSGNEDAIEAVTQNIEVFADYIRLKGKTQAKTPHSKRRAR